jgi:hypothetical protein
LRALSGRFEQANSRRARLLRWDSAEMHPILRIFKFKNK